MKTTYFEGQIQQFAQSDTQTEQCGLVLRNPEGLLYATHERNTHPDPRHFFAIDTETHLAAQANGTLVGYWHSHNPGSDLEPSPADKAVADELGLVCWVWIVETQTLKVYTPSTLKGPLEGRQFLPMVHDCVSLVWDYYREVLGVELPFVPRVQEDYARGFQGDIHGLLRQAKAQVVPGPPQRHDIILMALGKPYVNHMGVYIGEGIMLHQVLNRPSERTPYGGMWAKNTVALVRVPQELQIPDSQPVRPIWEKLPAQTTD